jgi:hypothetical protein
MKKQTKFSELKKHLIKKKSITSWEAITLFAETRLSARIFILKDKGWEFEDKMLTKKDKYGNATTYKLYKLLSYPKTNNDDKTC